MCSPALVAGGIQGAGVANQTASAYYGARTEKDVLNYQADIADINARVSDVAAQQELVKGSFEQGQIRQENAQVKSTQKVAAAASGLDVNDAGGTIQNLAETSDYLAMRDEDMVRANAARSAFGYKTQANNQRTDALFNRAQAKAISPWMRAGTTLLTGAGQVAGSFAANSSGSGGGGGGKPSGGGAPSGGGTTTGQSSGGGGGWRVNPGNDYKFKTTWDK